MTLEKVLLLLHSSQSINVYKFGKLLTTGFDNNVKDESYLPCLVSYVFSEDMDQISIELK